DGNSSAVSPFPDNDYQFGGQGGVGQLNSGSLRPETGNIEDFPPLGGLGEMPQDSRSGMINAAYGNTMNGGRQREQSIASAIGENRLPAGGNGFGRTLQGFGQSPQDGEPNGRFPQRPQQPLGQDGNFDTDSMDAPDPAQPPQRKRIRDMTPMEKFGLPGLLAKLPPDSPDYDPLAVGQDLTVLGLDLNRPDNEPLYPTWGVPFGNSMLPMIPDYTLPAVYTVTNVPSLASKMPSFSDETLFMIFYQWCRDIAQECAAQELYNRDWRWHIKFRQWMQKDMSCPPPVTVGPRQERGLYIFFDVTNWRRERKEFVLNYDDLDHRPATQLGQG
ncbi:hypothetical protein LTS18_000517, partial [Coniosporium uncinatum]